MEYDPEVGVYQLFRTSVPDWSPESPADLHGRCLTRLQRLQAQAGTSPARLSALLDELVRRLGSGAPIPSGAELGRVLGISRKRVSELLADLIQRSASLADED